MPSSISQRVSLPVIRETVNRAVENNARASARLVTGLRINSPSDDPGDSALATSLNRSKIQIERAEQNIAIGAQFAADTQSGLQALVDVTAKIAGLAYAATSYLIGDDQRTAISDEITSLRTEYGRIVSDSSSGGLQTLDGTSGTIQIATSPASGSNIAISTVSLSPTVSSISVGNVTQAVTGYVTALALYSSTVVQSDSFNGTTNRLANALNVLEDQRNNFGVAIDRITSADQAEEEANKVASKIRIERAVALEAQGNLDLQSVFRLLEK